MREPIKIEFEMAGTAEEKRAFQAELAEWIKTIEAAGGTVQLIVNNDKEQNG